MADLKNKKKYHRATYTFVMLSEDPIPDGLSLGDIEYMCDHGPNVGFFDDTKNEALDGKQMAAALDEAGSEPSFFSLDENGEEGE
jgi:hypothetical protein